jgi:4-aminobutyrate aminotransferase/(S)-3-amino-2-methylpropionate transaminase
MGRDGLVAHTASVGRYLVARLEGLAQANPGLWSQPRGAGTFAAIDAPDGPTRDRLVHTLRQLGVEAGGSGDRSIRFRPALVLRARHVDEAIDRFEAAAREVG